MSSESPSSSPADWATWTPTIAAEEEGKAAYEKRCAMSSTRGRGASPAVRGRGLRGGRAGSHMGTIASHKPSGAAAPDNDALAPTFANSVMVTKRVNSSSAAPSSNGSEKSSNGPSATANVLPAKKSDNHHPALVKTRICNLFESSDICRKYTCYWAHIKGEDAALILADLKASRACPFSHQGKYGIADCGFNHDAWLPSESHVLNIGFESPGPDEFHQEAEAGRLPHHKKGHQAMPGLQQHSGSRTWFRKTKQCSKYRVDQTCPDTSCIFAHVVGPDVTRILAEIKASRPCPFRHKSEEHKATCAFRHHPDGHKQLAKTSITRSDFLTPLAAQTHAISQRDDGSLLAESLSDELSLEGEVEADLAFKQFVLGALLLLAAALAGI